MPLINSTYPGPPWYQLNGHWQTLLPAFRRWQLPYRRERLELPDGDFLDLDWLGQEEADSLIILTHGLEGNSHRPYIQSAAHYFSDRGWDALAWNCRSCSGEMNRLPRLYHHGEIEDIGAVIRHALGQKPYRQIWLAGYSMGGSINTKYLAVNGKAVPEPLRGSIAFSSPFDLAASVDALEFPGNGFYKKRFLKQLSAKLLIKADRFPGLLDMSRLPEVDTWRDFDEWFTAPLLGLDSATAFYEMASAKNFLEGLQHPVLLVNALNDPIIPLACSPIELAREHPLLTLEMPEQGGHVGYSLSRSRYSWMDIRAWDFIHSRS